MSKSFAALLLFISPILFWSCNDNKKTPAAGGAFNNVTEVETFVATPALLDNVITTHGSILPNEEIELRNEIAGLVVRISFNEGAKVSKGQLLVQIDDSELQPNLEKNKVQLKIAKDDFERKKQLFDIQGISKDELEIAELRVANLEADIRLIDAQIRKSKIIAPFSGTVGLRQVSPGAFIPAGSMIARLVQSDPVKIEFSVPEIHASKISKGTTIEFKLANSDKTFAAVVYAFEPAIDLSTRSMRVRATAENKSEELKPGSYAELTITLQQIKDGLLVPALAITQDIRGQKVFIINQGKAVTKLIKTGIQQNDYMQITEGIAAGDTIITTALLSMRDGVAVKSKKTITLQTGN